MYASGGEPCCAECVTPVFSEAWSPRVSVKNKLPTHQEEAQDEVEVREEGNEGGGGGGGGSVVMVCVCNVW